MSLLDKSEAIRIITPSQFTEIKPKIDSLSAALRCNEGAKYVSGTGYNMDADNYKNSVEYATALYAAICFAQDTIHDNLDKYNLMVLRDCAVNSSDTYTYQQGEDKYVTLPKCNALGGEAKVVHYTSMNDSAINLAAKVVNWILNA